jgi:hypothetical protein
LQIFAHNEQRNTENTGNFGLNVTFGRDISLPLR